MPARMWASDFWYITIHGCGISDQLPSWNLNLDIVILEKKWEEGAGCLIKYVKFSWKFVNLD